MRPTNSTCPTCRVKIKRLRNVPVFEGARYCSSDCVLDAWQASKERAYTRELAAKLAAETFGRGTES